MEGQVGAGVGEQAWGSLAGSQQGGSKEAEEGSHSLLEAVQNLEEEGWRRIISGSLTLAQSSCL